MDGQMNIFDYSEYLPDQKKKPSKLDIPKAPIWHVSLNHVWEECPNCKIVNKAQDDVRVGYGAEAHYISVNRERCINCGQLFDWSDEAIEKACKYSKDYPRG